MAARESRPKLRHYLARWRWRPVCYALRRPWYASRIYRMRLRRTSADPPAAVTVDLWPGDAGRGQLIVDGDFAFAGRTLREADAPWQAADVSARWLADVAGFDWLRDLRAVGGEAARARARALVRRWIETEGDWRALSWRPDVIGARLANWLSQAEFLTAGADDEFRNAFHRSLRRQARHLQRVVRFAAPGTPRINAIKGLILGSLALEGGRRLDRWLRMLEAEIAVQVLGDGGHVSRNPSAQLAVLRHLTDVRAALRDGHHETPTALQTAIDRMAPMLRFFRHGDGRLALFNGSDEDEDWLIDVVLTRSEGRGKPLASAPHVGFERITANRTLLIVDTGSAPPAGQDDSAHAGALSFELSVGKERLVVNCGAHRGDSASWRAAQRTTAAHSTVTVEDVNSAYLLTDGGIGDRPEKVTVERNEADGDVWLEASHDGYRRPFSLVHQRRLFVDDGGGDVRGEDNLTGKGALKFVARFHLHPSVSASLSQDGRSVLLRLPSGAGWRFRAGGGVVGLQDSVYLGDRSAVKRSQQIVVSSATQNGVGQVKWAFARLEQA